MKTTTTISSKKICPVSWIICAAVSTIALWGRSMGAATALMFGDRDPFACMVWFSIVSIAFADLTQLFKEIVEQARDQGMAVPKMFVAVVSRS
jgi:hypothetical protein